MIRSRAGRGASAPVDSFKGTRLGAKTPLGAARVTVVEQRNVADPEASTDAPIIYVCITCRRAGEPESEPRPGTILAEATAKAAAGSGVVVRPVKCLANCNRGASAAIRNNGSWTYVFGQIDVACGPALVEGARLHNSFTGWQRPFLLLIGA